jgi:hypothetical protein
VITQKSDVEAQLGTAR